jgi:outer membrane protein assembly factor BamE (lipoprotein component of BamABCDE complex)
MRHLFVVPLLIFLAVGCGQKPIDQDGKGNQDRTGWRKLAKGMTPDKVRAILGEPMRVENEGEVTCWYYQEGQPLQRNAINANKWDIPRGSLLFSAKVAGGPKLTEWREP